MKIGKFKFHQKQFSNVPPRGEERWTKLGAVIVNKYEGFSVTEKYERHLPLASARRIAGIALAVLSVIGTLGLSLISKTVRQLFSGRQVIKVVVPRENASTHSPLPPPSASSKPIVPIPPDGFTAQPNATPSEQVMDDILQEYVEPEEGPVKAKSESSQSVSVSEPIEEEESSSTSVKEEEEESSPTTTNAPKKKSLTVIEEENESSSSASQPQKEKSSSSVVEAKPGSGSKHSAKASAKSVEEEEEGVKSSSTSSKSVKSAEAKPAEEDHATSQVMKVDQAAQAALNPDTVAKAPPSSGSFVGSASAISSESTAQLIENKESLTDEEWIDRFKSMSWEELIVYQSKFPQGDEVKAYLLERFDSAKEVLGQLGWEELQNDYPGFLELMSQEAQDALLNEFLLHSQTRRADLNSHAGDLLSLASGDQSDVNAILDQELNFIQRNSVSLKRNFEKQAGRDYIGALGVLADKLSKEQRIQLGKAVVAAIGKEAEWSIDEMDRKFQSGDAPEALAVAINENSPFVKLGITLGIIDLKRDVDGEPLLHALLDAEIEKIPEFIEDLTLDLDLQDSEGNSLLHKALDLESLGLARILIDEGAQIDLKNNDEKTPKMLAKEKGHKDLENRMTIDVLGQMRRVAPKKLKKAKIPTPVAARIKQAKDLNHLKILNIKGMDKFTGRQKIVPKPLRGVGDVFSFAGAAYQVWEADSVFLAQKSELEKDLSQLEEASRTARPNERVELQARMETKREEIAELERRRAATRETNALDAGTAFMKAGVYGAKVMAVSKDVVKKGVPVIGALTSAVAIYKTLASAEDANQKLKLLDESTRQLDYEIEALNSLKEGLEQEEFFYKLIELKLKELNKKKEFMASLQSDETWSRGLDQLATGAGAVGALITLVGVVFAPIALPAIAGAALAGAGLAPLVHGVLNPQVKAYYGILKESDFEPVTNENLEARRKSIAHRLGLQESELDAHLDPILENMDEKYFRKLLREAGLPFDKATFSEDKKIHLLNYLLN